MDRQSAAEPVSDQNLSHNRETKPASRPLSLEQIVIITSSVLVLIGLVFYLYLSFIKTGTKPNHQASDPTAVKEAQNLIKEKFGDQYNNWPIALEQENYHLWCISTQDMYRHEPFIELPDGSIVTHSIPCQYLDAEGNEQIVYIPAVRFNEDEKLIQYVGFQPVPNKPTYEKVWEAMTYGGAKEIGPMSLVVENGYTGAGHPFTLHFGLVEPDQIQAFASEVQAEIQANPEVFASSGDPADLYQQLLFPWIQLGSKNNFVRHVE